MPLLLQEYVFAALHTDVIRISKRASFKIHQSLAKRPFAAEIRGSRPPYYRHPKLSEGFV